MTSEQPTRIALDLHLGADVDVSVDGDRDQLPILSIASPGVDVMLSPAGVAVTAVDVAAADQLAEAAQAYAARLRQLRQT